MVNLRTIKDYNVFRCSWDDDRARVFYNPPLILHYGNNETVIGAGSSDAIYLFKIHQTDEVMLLTINFGLDYTGLEVFDASLSKVADVYFQGDWEVEEIGSLDDLSPITVAKRLYEYCDY